jgi:hypothetical protein
VYFLIDSHNSAVAGRRQGVVPGLDIKMVYIMDYYYQDHEFMTLMIILK